MAYEYEHEHRNMKAGVYSGLATNESVEEIKEVYRKAKAWEELKEEMRSMFVWGSDLPKGTPSKYMNEAYGIVFKTMCELDNTNEFSNLLSDLEDNQND